MGGLGNQLFQVSFGLNIQKDLNRDVVFTSALLDRAHAGTKRSLEVESLVEIRKHTLSIEINFVVEKLLKKINPSRFLVEDVKRPFSIDQIDAKTRIVMGYFQQLHFVNNVAEEIELLIRKSSRFSILDTCQFRRRIAVHIRLGDYRTSTSAKKFHGLTSIEYYLRAIENLHQQTGIEEVLIISDEPEVAEELLLPKINNRTFTLHVDRTGDAIQHLAKIANSAAIVGSNSTFSWWGAWLATRNYRANVVMPKPWFADASIMMSELMDTNWILLERNLAN
jgi:hypothetical protein